MEQTMVKVYELDKQARKYNFIATFAEYSMAVEFVTRLKKESEQQRFFTILWDLE